MLLSPEPVEPPGPLTPAIDRSVADTSDPYFFGWSKMTKALAEYRAGRYESAMEWLDKSRAHTPFNTLGEIFYRLLSAMTHHRLGHADAARQDLATADEMVKTHVSDFTALDIGGFGDILPLHIVRHEAGKLIAGEQTP